MNVLVFSPHFDDESIGCGGAISKHVLLENNDVYVVFMTNGKSGSTLLSEISDDDYSQMRKAEARKALDVLGVDRFECLDLDEGFMRFTPDLEKKLIKMIRNIKPNIVYAPHKNDRHNDHLITWQAVSQAVYRAGWDYFPCLGSVPHHVSEIRYYEVWTPLQFPNLYVDISEMVAIKEKAIRCYDSQLIQYKHDIASISLNRFRGLTGANVEYAEAFSFEKLEYVV